MFGKIIRKLRKERNITQDYLSHRKINQSNLSRFETGNSNISLNVFFELLNIMNIQPEEFLSLYSPSKLDEKKKGF